MIKFMKQLWSRSFYLPSRESMALFLCMVKRAQVKLTPCSVIILKKYENSKPCWMGSQRTQWKSVLVVETKIWNGTILTPVSSGRDHTKLLKLIWAKSETYSTSHQSSHMPTRWQTWDRVSASKKLQSRRQSWKNRIHQLLPCLAHWINPVLMRVALKVYWFIHCKTSSLNLWNIDITLSSWDVLTLRSITTSVMIS